jgi:3',5'-cyclic AMP phosphodiesterase CpdA
MTETFTLAHFSDVHLSPVVGFAPRYWNAKRALGYLNWQRGRRNVHQRRVADELIADALALRADHIAITGDLINLGLPAEYEAASSWLRGIGPPEHVTVVPGNHDVYTHLAGDAGIKRWAAYMGAEPETLVFPFVRRTGPLALIGLNSAVETPPFVAAGRLGGDQIEVVRDLLERLGDENVIRVVLIHHPPLPGLANARRGLADAGQFARVLEKSGAELVLYGHNHHPLLTWHPGSHEPVPVIGAASASAVREHKGEPPGRYGLFTFFLGPSGLRIRHTVRGFAPGGSKIAKLSEHVLDHGGG